MPQGLDPNGPLRIAYLTYRGKPHVGGQGVYTVISRKHSSISDMRSKYSVASPTPCSMSASPSRNCQASTSSTTTIQAVSRFGNSKLAKISSRSVSSQPVCSLNHWPSAPAHIATSHRAHEFDLIHDNQCLGWGIKRLEKIIPTIVTLHHPITRDRALEMAAAPNFYKRWSIGRWYSFVKMQGKVASQMPRVVVVSENSINDIHADMGVALDRMRLVPLVLTPNSSPHSPHRAKAWASHHHCICRRGPERPRIPHRGDGRLTRRRARHLAHDHRSTQTR